MPGKTDKVQIQIQDSNTLFKNWTRLTNKNGIQTEVKEFEIIEREDDWFELDNSKSQEAEHAYLRNYAHGEFLAHKLAYQNLPHDSMQQVLEKDGSYAEYKTIRLTVNHKGLVGYILVPTTLKPDTNPDIKVVFQGTDPCSTASCLRDLELGGAGSISFADNRRAILQQINEAIHAFNQERNMPNGLVNVTVAGHSLGGADAQNCHTALLQAISDGCKDIKKQSDLNHIQNCRLFTYNSAGVPEATAKRSVALAKDLAELRKEGKTNVTIESYNQRVGGDGVQQTGEAHVLNNVPAEYAKVDILKAHIGYEHHNKFSPTSAAAAVAAGTAAASLIGAPIAGAAVAMTVVAASAGFGIKDTAVAHTQHCFEQPIQASYEALSNATPEGQKEVHTELNKKSWWINALHKGAGMLFGFKKHIAETAPSLVPCPVPVNPAPAKPWYRRLF